MFDQFGEERAVFERFVFDGRSLEKVFVEPGDFFGGDAKLVGELEGKVSFTWEKEEADGSFAEVIQGAVVQPALRSGDVLIDGAVEDESGSANAIEFIDGRFANVELGIFERGFAEVEIIE